MPHVTPQFKAPQTITAGGSALPRRKRLAAESARTLADRDQRAECRSVVLARDRGICQFHRMAARHGASTMCQGAQRPYGWATGPEVHEVVTRARGGDPLDPENCVTLCPWANNEVGERQAGAECLGLLLPSWASADDENEARVRRVALATFVGPRVGDIGWPTWRRSEIGNGFDERAIRDFTAWGFSW